MEDFQIGQKVQLNSGGPVMTIQRIIGADKSNIGLNTADEFLKLKGYKEGDVICQWFSDSSLKDGTFRKESLIKVE